MPPRPRSPPASKPFGFLGATTLRPPLPSSYSRRNEMKPSISVIAAARRLPAHPRPSQSAALLPQAPASRRRAEKGASPPIVLLAPRRPSSPLPVPLLSRLTFRFLMRRDVDSLLGSNFYGDASSNISGGSACSRLCLTSVLREVYYPPSGISLLPLPAPSPRSSSLSPFAADFHPRVASLRFALLASHSPPPPALISRGFHARSVSALGESLECDFRSAGDRAEPRRGSDYEPIGRKGWVEGRARGSYPRRSTSASFERGLESRSR